MGGGIIDGRTAGSGILDGGIIDVRTVGGGILGGGIVDARAGGGGVISETPFVKSNNLGAAGWLFLGG